MNLQDARRCFPGLKNKVFLDAACVSLVPRQSRDAIMELVEMTVCCPAADASLHHIQLDQMRGEAVQQAARLVNTDPNKIALVESTTHGLNIAANAIPLERGDKVVLADTDFLQVAIPWCKKRDSIGIEIIIVQSGDRGVLTTGDFDRMLDASTKVVCVSSVQWSTGYRLNMQELGELCRSRGIWLVVDAVQELGAMEVDLQARYADFLMAGGHKWLNSPFGCGVLYTSDRALSELQPGSYGYLALEEPQDGWGEYFRTPETSPLGNYVFPAVAKSFEIGGTANYPGAVALGESLKLTNELGIQIVEEQVRRLTDLLHFELARIGAHVVTDPDPCVRSGITVFNLFDTLEEDKALLDQILRQNVYVSMRYTSNKGGIRVSTHFYNTEEDVLKLVRTIEKCVKEGSVS